MKTRKAATAFFAVMGAIAATVFWLDCQFQYHETLGAIGAVLAVLHLIDYAREN